MSQFSLACAVADVWTASVRRLANKASSDGGGAGTATLVAEAMPFLQKLGYLGEREEVGKAYSDDLSRAVKKLDRFYAANEENGHPLSPEALLNTWWQQAHLYRHLAPPSAPPPEESAPVSRAGNRRVSLYYAELLDQRLQSAAPRHFMHRPLRKWIKADDINQKIDEEIRDFLRHIAKVLPEDPPPRQNGQTRDDVSFGSESPFGPDVFWPVPAIARFLEQLPEGSTEELRCKKNPKPNLDAFYLSRQFVLRFGWDYFSKHPKAILQLWRDLVRQVLCLPEFDPQTALPKIVEAMYRTDNFWGEIVPADWQNQCLRATAAIDPQIQIIPGFTEEGQPDWAALEKDELVIGFDEHLHPSEVVLRFGIRGQKPAQLKRACSGKIQEDWDKWNFVSQLDNPRLNERYRKERARLCGEGLVMPVGQAVREEYEAPNGADWYHDFIEKSRSCPEKRKPLRWLWSRREISLCPPINEDGEAVWGNGLENAPGARKVDRGLCHAAEKPSLIQVHRFAPTLEGCELEYAPPLDPQYLPLAKEIQKSNDTLDPELHQPLQSFYAACISGEELVESYLEVVEVLFQSTQKRITPEDRAVSLFRELRRVCAQRQPPLVLLPSSFNLVAFKTCPEEQGVDLLYEYSDTVPQGNVCELRRFGAKVGPDICRRAEVVLSAGVAPPGYLEVLAHVEAAGDLLNSQVKAILSELPQREATAEREKLYHELFLLLWPWVISDEQVQELNSNSHMGQVRKWYCDAVKSRKVFLVEVPKVGDWLMNEKWELKRTFDFVTPPTDLANCRVDKVARPLLIFFRDQDRRIPKEKAVLYATDH